MRKRVTEGLTLELRIGARACSDCLALKQSDCISLASCAKHRVVTLTFAGHSLSHELAHERPHAEATQAPLHTDSQGVLPRTSFPPLVQACPSTHHDRARAHKPHREGMQCRRDAKESMCTEAITITCWHSRARTRQPQT